MISELNKYVHSLRAYYVPILMLLDSRQHMYLADLACRGFGGNELDHSWAMELELSMHRERIHRELTVANRNEKSLERPLTFELPQKNTV